MISQYGYIYEIVNNINGKTYIGQRLLKKDKSWEDYYGSGVLIKNAIKKYGKENFTKNLICYCDSREQLDNTETQVIINEKAKGKAEYNLTAYHAGGDTFNKLSKDKSVEVKLKISEGMKSSKKLKKYYKKLKTKNALFYSSIYKENKSEIFRLYNSNKYTIDELAKQFNIPVNRLRLFLKNDNIKLNNRREKGHFVSEETKLKISMSYYENKACKIDYQNCKNCKKIFVVKANSRKKVYCSRNCYKESKKVKKIEDNEMFIKKYIHEKLSLSQLESYFNVKQRTIYSKISELGLPTFSKR